MQTVDAHELLRQAPLKLIAARVKRARKNSAHHSLDLLAEAVGTSRQNLIQIEHARQRPRLVTLEAISAATGRPLDYFLLEESGEPNPFPAEAA